MGKLKKRRTIGGKAYMKTRERMQKTRKILRDMDSMLDAKYFKLRSIGWNHRESAILLRRQYQLGPENLTDWKKLQQEWEKTDGKS